MKNFAELEPGKGDDEIREWLKAELLSGYERIISVANESELNQL